jgi:hypothetical protein
MMAPLVNLVAAMSRRWRKDSIFGDGPRVRLDREQQARFRALLNLNRKPGRLTPAAREVGRVLLALLGNDGRCDPAIDTLKKLTGFGRSAVIEGLARLRACGFLDWRRRLTRTGWRAEQTSNAYWLLVPTPARIVSACESGFRPEVSLDLNLKRLKRESLAVEDAKARESAARQLRVLGFPIPKALEDGH